MDRVMADCRRFESDANCQLTIIGPADDVVAAAVQHAVASHGHQDTPEMREQLRAMLEPESAYVAGGAAPKPHRGGGGAPPTRPPPDPPAAAAGGRRPPAPGCQAVGVVRGVRPSKR